MSRVTHPSITLWISAPVERVWTVLIDVERWPEWTPSITSVKRLDEGAFGMGSRAAIRQPKLAPAVWQVVEFDAGRNFTWVMRKPGLRVAGAHLAEADGDATLVTLSLEFGGVLEPLLARLYRGLNQSYLAMEAEGLRHRAES